MLFVEFPLSLVHGTVEMLVDTEALGLIIDPKALVDVSICVNQASLAIRFIVRPQALVNAPV